MMFVYSILLIVLNRRSLPDAIKVRSYRLGALIWSVAFFGTLTVHDGDPAGAQTDLRADRTQRGSQLSAMAGRLAGMLDTSARLLKLLSLLQAHKEWSGPELSERLGVSTRTIRNDVDRLRELGYPVHATPGVAGGYRLGAGAALPPLLLDDEEAVAVAVGLGRAAGGGVAGIEETSVRALAKLEQVLPSRLRRRVDALNTGTVQIPGAARRWRPRC